MQTKYDVFTKIIEHAPCKASDLRFKTPIYKHIHALQSAGWIKSINKTYVPINNKRTALSFKIIKYCLNNGLNYNKFFSKNMPFVLKELANHTPNLRPIKLKANKENTEILKYLEKNQFLLLIKKKPRRGIMLNHQLFSHIFELNQINAQINIKYTNITKEILKIKTDPINPFDDNIFRFLTGTAQLEGSTITEGETKDIILKDIYPDKPKKDIQMVKNLNEAMHHVIEHLSENITPEQIMEINKLTMFSMHRNAGKYKITNNRVQGNPNFKTAEPREVPLLMQKYCENLNKIINKEQCLNQLGQIHNDLQRIHPFSDGNSRTTRTVLNWMLLKHNLPLLVLKMGCFDEYMRLTKFSKTREDKKLTNLLQHLLLHENLIN
jgi:Fic family protein